MAGSLNKCLLIGNVGKDPEIERLARMSGASVPTRSQAIHRSFTPGDRVEIIRGPFQGWLVDVKSIRGRAAEIIIPMLGAERVIEIGLDDLEAA